MTNDPSQTPGTPEYNARMVAMAEGRTYVPGTTVADPRRRAAIDTLARGNAEARALLETYDRDAPGAWKVALRVTRLTGDASLFRQQCAYDRERENARLAEERSAPARELEARRDAAERQDSELLDGLRNEVERLEDSRGPVPLTVTMGWKNSDTARALLANHKAAVRDAIAANPLTPPAAPTPEPPPLELDIGPATMGKPST